MLGTKYTLDIVLQKEGKEEGKKEWDEWDMFIWLHIKFCWFLFMEQHGDL